MRAVAAGNKRHVQVMYAELQQAEERARKAERAADLLADSHRRAEQAEAALARVRAIAEEHPAGIDTALIHAALDGTEQQPDDSGRLIAEYQAAILRVLALRQPIAQALEQADYRPDMQRGDLADSIMPVIRAAVDGTEQPTTEDDAQ